MRLPRQLFTVAVLTAGAALGYLAASAGPQPFVRAETARPVSGIVAVPTANGLTTQTPCCDAKLDRSSACADSVELADASAAVAAHNLAVAATAQATGKKPNILVIWGDDIGYWNISHNNHGMMGYKTPNIDRIAKGGAMFTDWYGQQSCTAGRACFITGQVGFRTGLLKVGLPGAKEGLKARDVTIAELLKGQGYMTAQFGKNHLGDADDTLPTAHGFDEFFGSLYHLNAEEEFENPDYFKDPEMIKRFETRGVLHCWANPDGTQKIESTGSRVYPVHYPAVVAMALRTTVDGPLKDRRVRQALNYGVNKEAYIASMMHGMTNAAGQPAARNVFGHQPDIKPYL